MGSHIDKSSSTRYVEDANAWLVVDLLILHRRSLRINLKRKIVENMARKIFMAIHKFHSDQSKKEFFGGMPERETTDREWA